MKKKKRKKSISIIEGGHTHLEQRKEKRKRKTPQTKQNKTHTQKNKRKQTKAKTKFLSSCLFCFVFDLFFWCVFCFTVGAWVGSFAFLLPLFLIVLHSSMIRGERQHKERKKGGGRCVIFVFFRGVLRSRASVISWTHRASIRSRAHRATIIGSTYGAAIVGRL
jgi:hypothetical protein